MKKLLIAASLAAVLVSGAQAQDMAQLAKNVSVGVVGGGNADTGTLGMGLTVDKKWGPWGAEVTWTRTTSASNPVDQNANRTALLGSYELFKVVGTSWALKGGTSFTNASATENRWAGVLGTGVTIPLGNKFSLIGDYQYQWASGPNPSANLLFGGVKYTF